MSRSDCILYATERLQAIRAAFPSITDPDLIQRIGEELEQAYDAGYDAAVEQREYD